jgi:hypothetical protein
MPRGRPFPRGVSGNPGGRPTESEEYKTAITRLDGKAVKGLENILDDPDHRKFADVCMYVINRNHGKPVETHELSGLNGGPIETSDPLAAMDSEQRAKLRATLEAKMSAALAAKKPADGSGG